MSKKCKACGSDMPDEARFCQKCGANEFVEQTNEETTVLNPAESPYQNTQQVNSQASFNQANNYNGQAWQQPITPQKPKKKKTGLIIGIVVGVLIVLAAIGFFAEKYFQNKGYGEDNKENSGAHFNLSDKADSENENDSSSDGDSDINSDDQKTEYTKGTFDGKTYINEWAEIKAVLPSDFSDADSATYSAAENATTDCGFYWMSNDSMNIIYICFEKIPKNLKYDEEKYLDACMEQIKKLYAGVDYEFDTSYSTKTIAGHTYTVAECPFNNGYGDFVNSIYVRKQDDIMIAISAMGVSTESNDSLTEIIESTK